MLDLLWMNHLENMEALRESVRLRAYGQHDPLVEYRREGHLLFQQLLADFDKWMEENAERLKESTNIEALNSKQTQNSNDQNSKSFRISDLGFRVSSDKKVGRNDPCPCEAKHSDGRPMKYKKCHGK